LSDQTVPAATLNETMPDEVKRLVQHTQQIWEDKAIGLIYENYRHNLKVHTSLGYHYGRDEVITTVVQQLAAFPDTRLYDSTVIWSTNKAYVSHAATLAAHNTGYGVFGAPTEKRVCYRLVMDYVLRDGRVIEAWTVHDGLSMVRQLGLGVEEAVSILVNQRPGSQFQPSSQAVGELERLRGQEPPEVLPSPTRDDVGSLVEWAWHEIWNRRRLDRITQLYAPNYRFLGPSGRRFGSANDYAAHVLSLLAAFPDAVMQLEHLIYTGEGEYKHIAIRWRLLGTHEGHGVYGSPTGRRISVLGITHQTLREEKFIKEWTVFDELALWRQLCS
jgi:predicted ester cyclase